MAKNTHPAIENPLAGMALDDIVRGITNPAAPAPAPAPAQPAPAPAPQPAQPSAPASESEPQTDKQAPEPREEPTPRQPRQRRASAAGSGNKLFDENLQKYTGISEQGIAIWLPKEVKKRLEMIRIDASRNIPLRSLAAAIIMTYIAENEDSLRNL